MGLLNRGKKKTKLPKDSNLVAGKKDKTKQPIGWTFICSSANRSLVSRKRIGVGAGSMYCGPCSKTFSLDEKGKVFHEGEEIKDHKIEVVF